MTKVVVNGCFDILHVGHIALLDFARSIPNSTVLVLIDSDRRVKELKGKNRPINNQDERAKMLLALRSVDKVQIFDSDQELSSMIQQWGSDIMVKGDEYAGRLIIGGEHCKEIRFLEKIPGQSTTNKILAINKA